MQRILIRSPKGPFDVVDPETTVRKDLILSNVGNLLFLQSAYKILKTQDVEITPDGFAEHKLGPAEINEKFDVYVIPLANGFRASFSPYLSRMTKVIEQLKIPVVLLGGGLQASMPYRPGIKRPQDEVVKAFMRAVLDRSPAVGVRGEYTQDYLGHLGFRDVEVIGCPSMFLHGRDLQVTRRTPALDRDSRVGINITARITPMGPIAMRHMEKYPNLRYVGQEMDCLKLLLWGEGLAKMPDPNLIPVHASHPLIREGKTLFWVDPWPWLDATADMDFIFGTRIHGNIAGILSGTPAFVLGHDTRTVELARYFQIPNMVMSDVPEDVDAADLYEQADYEPMMAGHDARFATFTGYIERQGLRHVFMEGEDDTWFDRQVASTPYPPSVAFMSGSTRMRLARKVALSTRRRWRRLTGPKAK
jgi:hypothetical protein